MTAPNADYFATHNSDGTTRMPWQGGPAIGPDAPEYVCLPGTETVNRALNIVPGTANTPDNPVRVLTVNVSTGLPLLSEIEQYNTPEQIEAERAKGRAAGEAHAGAFVPAPVAPTIEVAAPEPIAAGQPSVAVTITPHPDVPAEHVSWLHTEIEKLLAEFHKLIGR